MLEELATNPAPVAEDSAPTEVATEPEATPTDESEESQTETTQADDTDEVEHEGQKYRIPKALKPALMMNADYTRKTQELAEHRRALEAERNRTAEQAQAQIANIKDVARLVALDDEIGKYQSQLDQYANIDWYWLELNDPNYKQHRATYERARDNLDRAQRAHKKLHDDLDTKQREMNAAAQRENAKRAEQSRAELLKLVPEWSPDLDVKLTNFALGQGLSEAQIRGAAISNPAAVKILHLAYLGQQLLEKQKAATVKTPVKAEPVPTVTTSRTSAAKDPERLKTESWMEWRSKQVAARKSR